MNRKGKVHVWQSRDGWRWRAKAPNGKIIGPTENFSCMRKARADFAAVVKYAPVAVEA